MGFISSINEIIVIIFSVLSLLGLIKSLFEISIKNKRFQKWDLLQWIDKSKHGDKKRKISVSCIVIIILGIYLANSNTFLDLIGVHSLENLVDGTYSYYVEAEANDKKYTIPGKIEIQTQEYENASGKSEYITYYSIQGLYFPDGEFISFENNEDRISSLQNGLILTDDTGTEWKCKITNQHAYCRQISETTFVTSKNIAMLATNLIVLVGSWIGYLMWDEEECKKYDSTKTQNGNSLGIRVISGSVMVILIIFTLWIILPYGV